jgi:hypothetical protein
MSVANTPETFFGWYFVLSSLFYFMSVESIDYAGKEGLDMLAVDVLF